MAFFSGMEIAFVSSDKLRVQIEKNQGLFSGKIVGWFSGRMEYVIATTLLGMNVCLVIFGFKIAVILKPVIARFIENTGWSLVIQTITATILVLLVAEFIPKAFFRARSNRMLRFFAIPFIVFYFALFPITWITVKLSDFFLIRVFKVKGSDRERQMVFGKVDLDHLVQENTTDKPTETQADQEIKLFKNALAFSNVRIRDCLIPRTEIQAVQAGDDIGLLRQKFIETGYSRILIYENDIDHIIGYIHHSDLFRNPANIRSILRPVLPVPETMAANKLLARMLRDRQNLALVIDEFGTTAGLVTSEDILEEIFGEIEDEHDTPVLEETQLSDNQYRFSGRLEIDYLNETYGLKLPVSESYETLAGLILHHHPTFPRVNDTIRIEPYTFRILKSTHTRIEIILLSL